MEELPSQMDIRRVVAVVENEEQLQICLGKMASFGSIMAQIKCKEGLVCLVKVYADQIPEELQG